MSKKDVFQITLKIIGLIYLLSILAVLPVLISILVQSNFDEIIYTIPLQGTQLIVALLLIFKSDWLIRFFKLSEGYENELHINLSSPDKTKILEIGIILFATIWAIRVVYQLILNLLFVFRISINPNRVIDHSRLNDLNGLLNSNMSSVYEQLFALVCAFMLIAFSTKISRWISKISEERKVGN